MGPHFSRESLMDKGVLPANRKMCILSRSCENQVGRTEETPENLVGCIVGAIMVEGTWLRYEGVRMNEWIGSVLWHALVRIALFISA